LGLFLCGVAGFFEDLRVACFWAGFNGIWLVFWACFLQISVLWIAFFSNFMTLCLFYFTAKANLPLGVFLISALISLFPLF